MEDERTHQLDVTLTKDSEIGHSWWSIDIIDICKLGLLGLQGLLGIG